MGKFGIVKSTYTKQIGLRDLDIFRKECGQFYNQEVVKRVPKVMKFTAAITIHQLIKRSPVLTGAYMLRHRLNKQAIAANVSTRIATADELRRALAQRDIKPNQPRSSAIYRKIRRKARQNLFRKLRSTPVRLGGKGLRLANSIKYARKVEYGWPTARGYRVYGQAYENTRMILDAILQRISIAKWKSQLDTKKIDDKMKRELIESAIKADEIGDILEERRQMARDKGYTVE